MGVGARARNDAQCECKTDGKVNLFWNSIFPAGRLSMCVHAFVCAWVGACCLRTKGRLQDNPSFSQ